MEENTNNKIVKINNSQRPKLKKEEDRKKALELSKKIDHNSSNSILNFGLEAQRKLSKNSDNLLNKIKSKDSGEVGEAITSLLNELNYVDVDKLTDKKDFLSTLPVIGQFFDKAKKTMIKYNSVSENIDNIVEKLDDSRRSLIRDTVTLDNLYTKNIEYIDDLNINIEAGYLKLDDINNNLIPEKEKEIEENPNDNMIYQELSDLKKCKNNLEKKVHDLELSKAATIQSLPQIRLIQNNNETLISKIQNSVVNTIPLWKNQVTVALAINRQKKILDISKQMSDTTNELLKKNSSLLKQNTIDTAKENERSVIDISTLKETNKDLISIVEEVNKINNEGRKNRQKAQEELNKIENQLHSKILEAKRNKQKSLDDSDIIDNNSYKVDNEDDL